MLAGTDVDDPKRPRFCGPNGLSATLQHRLQPLRDLQMFLQFRQRLRGEILQLVGGCAVDYLMNNVTVWSEPNVSQDIDQMTRGISIRFSFANCR